MTAPDAVRRQRVLAAVAALPSPTRRQARSRAVAVTGATSALAVALLLVGASAWHPARPTALLWPALVGTLPIAVGALWTACRRGRSMVGRAPPTLRALLLAVPYLLLGARRLTTSLLPHGPDPPVAAPESALACALTLAVVALAPLCGLHYLRRDSEARNAGPVGAALGVAVGAAAWALLDLRCASAEAAHLLCGHVAPVLGLGLLGELLGRLVLPIRRAPLGSPVAARRDGLPQAGAQRGGSG